LHLNSHAANLSDKTLPPGLYKWTSTVNIATVSSTLTFEGTDSDVWIMQVAGTFTAASASRMVLKGGAKADNIVWVIAEATTFGTNSHVEGVFLAQTNIVFQTGASGNGAFLAQTAVTLDAATIAKPPPPCGWGSSGLTPDWQFTTSGGGAWTSSSSMIRFDIENDAICGGTNTNTQSGSASWTFTLPAAAEITLSMTGVAEAHYEQMTLSSDGNVVAMVQAQDINNVCQVGTCDMCQVSMPSTTLSLAAGEHTLAVYATTKDGAFHKSCFFEIDFDLGLGLCPEPSPGNALTKRGGEEGRVGRTL